MMVKMSRGLYKDCKDGKNVSEQNKLKQSKISTNPSCPPNHDNLKMFCIKVQKFGLSNLIGFFGVFEHQSGFVHGFLRLTGDSELAGILDEFDVEDAVELSRLLDV